MMKPMKDTCVLQGGFHDTTTHQNTEKSEKLRA